MGNAQSTSGNFCQNPGNAYPPTTGFTNPGFDGKAINQVTDAVNSQTRQTKDMFVHHPDKAAKVLNTAHALLECDRQYRAASAACDSAVKGAARVGAVTGALVAGSAKKSPQDICLGAMSTGITGAINE